MSAGGIELRRMIPSWVDNLVDALLPLGPHGPRATTQSGRPFENVMFPLESVAVIGPSGCQETDTHLYGMHRPLIE